MSSSVRGDFALAKAGEAKGFDYSLLLTDEDNDAAEDSASGDQASGGQLAEEASQSTTTARGGVEIPVRMASPRTEADGSWNTVHKVHHHQQSQTAGQSGASVGRGSYGRQPGAWGAPRTRPVGNGDATVGGDPGAWGARRPHRIHPGANHGNVISSRPPQSHPHHHPHHSQEHHPCKEYTPTVLSEETSVELYDFPSELRTQDLRQLLAGFEGCYRLKWNNDTSCWAVFAEAGEARRFLEQPLARADVKLRPYHPSQATPKPPAATTGSLPAANDDNSSSST
jgi:hypothetical protein